jgi:glutamate-1-semialdehyde 2,1-aminomutase
MTGCQGSRDAFARACQVIPGGVNSPVRAFGAVGGDPPFIARAEGAYLYDEDGRSYVDYVLSWGPLILGHRHPAVVEALQGALERGTSFGAATLAEVELAEEIVAALPGVEMVRLVNSGTEATMSAVRLARAYTRRDKIVKFEGCYHGHADAFLIAAGSGALTFGVPTSPGVPAAVAQDTLVAPFNDLARVEEIFARHGEEIAAVVVEPVAGNMGVVVPEPGYLEGLREITCRHGSLLIFDEVITGFRLAFEGAQGYFGVIPDLTCLGKIIGGGLPVGAYGGRRKIMEMVAPSGPVYQAGTLSGNPLAVAAGLAVLRVLKNRTIYDELARRTEFLAAGLTAAAREAGVPVRINHIGSMLTVFFTDGPVRDYTTARRSDTKSFAAFFRAMLEQGVYLPPSQFEAWFLSAAHGEKELRHTLEAARKAFAAL